MTKAIMKYFVLMSLLFSTNFVLGQCDWLDNNTGACTNSNTVDIYRTGNVSIGNTTPTNPNKLDVDGSINISNSNSYKVNGVSILATSPLGSNSAGLENVSLGQSTGNTNLGRANTFLGASAGGQNNNGEYNTFVGVEAGAYNNDGIKNTCIGVGAGIDGLSGNNNTFLGVSAGAKNLNDSNTFIGAYAGIANKNSKKNTYLGYQAHGSDNLINATAIGANAQVEADNCLVLGSIANITGTIANTNVGIGTTTPQEKLHVSGTIRSSDLSGGGNVCADANGNLILSGTCASSNGQDEDWLSTNGTTPTSIFEDIYTYGNVGIGVSNPTKKLHVEGESFLNGDTYLTNPQSNGASGGRLILASGASNGLYHSIGANNYWTEFRSHTNEGWKFITSNNNATRMLIDGGTGNVGIGTSNPKLKLEIYKGDLFFNGQNACNYRMHHQFWDPNGHLIISPTDNTGNFKGTGIVMNCMGNVGIGHVPNFWKLYVQGYAAATGGWYSGSDKRYKKDIHQITDAQQIVQQLSGKKYQFNTEKFPDKNFSKGKTYGFIAQEIEKVIPEIVQKDEDGYYAINYDAIIPILTEAIKDQQVTISKQQETISAQDEKMAKLESRLERIEALLSNKETAITNPNISTAEEQHKQTQQVEVKTTKLAQNVPNPFKQSTQIAYQLSKESDTQTKEIVVYNLQGKVVQRYPLATTNGILTINANDFNNGAYIYSLFVNGKLLESKKMIIQ